MNIGSVSGSPDVRNFLRFIDPFVPVRSRKCEPVERTRRDTVLFGQGPPTSHDLDCQAARQSPSGARAVLIFFSGRAASDYTISRAGICRPRKKRIDLNGNRFWAECQMSLRRGGDREPQGGGDRISARSIPPRVDDRDRTGDLRNHNPAL